MGFPFYWMWVQELIGADFALQVLVMLNPILFARCSIHAFEKSKQLIVNASIGQQVSSGCVL